MSDPIRLLDDPSFGGSLPTGGDARRLLELGRDMAPPADAQAQGWSGLQSVIGGAAAGAALGTPSAASSASAGSSQAASGAASANPAATKTGVALGTKLGLAGVVVGAALFATTLVRQPSNTLSETPPAASFAQGDSSESGDPHALGSRGFSSQLTTNASPIAPKEAPAKEAEAPPAAQQDAQASAPRTSAPATATTAVEAPVDRVSQLQDESAAVQQARSQLASNNASGALKTLSQLDVDVPRGILGQERTVLTIEALKKSGQGAAAAQRAAAFIEANPKSPYAERLRAYLQ